MRDRVQYSPDVPRWFTYLHHLWQKRRCTKVGHTFTQWLTVCDYCGQILR